MPKLKYFRRTGVFLLFLSGMGLGSLTSAPHAPVDAPAGRIVMITDGNAHDPDDVIGTPVALALLQAAGLEERLVSICHSSELTNKKIFNLSGGDEEQLLRQQMNQDAFDEYVSVWGGYEDLTIWNCRVPDQYAQAVAEILAAIDASTQENPLWVIEAGEPDVLYDAVVQADPAKLRFVTVVTHHKNNDLGSDRSKSLWEIEKINTPAGIQVARISADEPSGQNVNLKTSFEDWHWARDHGDPRLAWLYEKGVFAGNHAYGDITFKYRPIAEKFDCSDAGMMFWWLTGSEVGTPADCRDLLLGFIDPISD